MSTFPLFDAGTFAGEWSENQRDMRSVESVENPSTLSPEPSSHADLDMAQRAIRHMVHAKSPSGMPVQRWNELAADLTAFADQWLGQAMALGWSLRELFGCPDDPFARRVDLLGLVPSLGGSTVTAIEPTFAALRHEDGSASKFYRHAPGVSVPFDMSSAALIWDVYGTEEAL